MTDHSHLNDDFNTMLEPAKPIRDLRWVLGIFIVLFLGSAYQIAQQVLAVGVTFTPRAQRWLIVIGLVGIALFDLGLLAASWTNWGKSLSLKLIQFPEFLLRFRGLSWLLLALVVIGFPILVLGFMGDLLIDPFPRLLVFGVFVIIGAISLKTLFPKIPSRGAGIGIGLIIAFVYHMATLLVQVTDYPFSLSWSETSRYYLGSLFAAEKIYGMQVPPSVLHPTRYLMQAIPFFVNDIPLWGHRLWQMLVWIIFTVWAGYLLARRLELNSKYVTILISLWVYLSLFQGPVYYHLLVPVIIILGWFDSQKFWRNLVLVILASAWAGISRVNWYPVPAMLAAVLYILEKKQGDETLWKYLIQPAIWGIIGVGVAFGSQTLYMLTSGHDPELFTSSFSSDLLWYRLFPNVTYPLGILFNVLIVSFPLLWIVLAQSFDDRQNWSIMRVIVQWAAILVLLAGGLVVSVKIGGGSNLHNVDAYLVVLIVIVGYIYFRRYTGESEKTDILKKSWPGTLFLVAIPVYFATVSGGPLELPDSRIVAASLDAVHQHVNYAASDGEDILFISQRHLLHFDDRVELALIPEYEKVFFMEMIMARNPTYLSDFYVDLQSQRFAAIVSDQVVERYKDRDEAWSEEHNVWAQFVSRPLLCYYQPRLTLRVVQAQILFPRTNVENCPAISENQQILAEISP